MVLDDAGYEVDLVHCTEFQVTKFPGKNWNIFVTARDGREQHIKIEFSSKFEAINYLYKNLYPAKST